MQGIPILTELNPPTHSSFSEGSTNSPDPENLLCTAVQLSKVPMYGGMYVNSGTSTAIHDTGTAIHDD